MSRPTDVRIDSHLIRERDALVVYGDFRFLLQDLDLHLLSQGVQHDAFTRHVLADGLTALGLHLSSRPPDEYVGWTVSIQKPLMNLFFTGSLDSGCIVGRAFLEGVEPRQDNTFISQTNRGFGDAQLSSVSVQSVDLFEMVEEFYRQSEQKEARYFHEEPAVALLVALPGADLEWIGSVGTREVFSLPGSAQVEHLATRHLSFRCGCDRNKIAGILVGAYGASPETLFSQDAEIEVECPRCAGKITVTREEYDRILNEVKDSN